MEEQQTNQTEDKKEQTFVHVLKFYDPQSKDYISFYGINVNLSGDVISFQVVNNDEQTSEFLVTNIFVVKNVKNLV